VTVNDRWRICFEFRKGVVEREKGAEIVRRVRPADAA
jgi:plasmid maintenance system killer protein